MAGGGVWFCLAGKGDSFGSSAAGRVFMLGQMGAVAGWGVIVDLERFHGASFVCRLKGKGCRARFACGSL